MKKKIISTRPKSTKIKQKVVALDSSVSGDELYAYKLIQMFAGAIKALNGGCLPLPAHWKSCLQNALKSEGKGGRTPNPEIRERQVKLAKDVIKERMQAKEKGERTALCSLYDGTNKYPEKNIYREIKNHIGDAVTEMLTEKEIEKKNSEYEKRKEEMQPIKQRIENGELLDDILYDSSITTDQYIAIRNLQKYETPLEGYPPERIFTEREKAYLWMNAGMNLYIAAPDDYQTFFNPDIKIINAAYPKKEK